MSKRKPGEVTHEDLSKPIKLSKPSLDSDEEDYQGEESFRLREADIEGQESATVEYDGDIKITPFNMREELEEDGYFDGSGNFIFKKSVEAKDNWLEDIDWTEVNRLQNASQGPVVESVDEAPTAPMDDKHKIDLYSQLVKYMNPGESVLRSIKRMGAHSNSKTSASASQRWLKKKNTPVGQNGDPEGLLRVTEMADQLLQAGEFDVYQTTYESIKERIRRSEETEPEDELEALGQALDAENPSSSDNTTTNGNKPEAEHPPVMWHLKRSESPDAKLEGPYSCQQLKQWVESDHFANSSIVLVRQVDRPDGPFYNIHRIDFDLYE